MKLNKKGFTLAELLIVIAIIAILIAIAIPTFAGALENARLQTDHANIRSAYAAMQVAKLNGGILEEDGTVIAPTTVGPNKWYFQKDGSLVRGTVANVNTYQLQTNGDNTILAPKKCSESAGCIDAATFSNAHEKGKVIVIVYNAAVTSADETINPDAWHIFYE